jgi:hypothetical protein
MRDPTSHDVADRFVWAVSRAERSVQLHCEAHAVEAARRAARITRNGDDPRCYESGHSGPACLDDRPGHQERPSLYFERGDDGRFRLIGFWNGLLGDANREDIERWRRSAACGEVLDEAESAR